jgi:hypothetical protein
MSKKRNRAEGWTFAKLSGHKNENRLAKLINDDPLSPAREYRQ